MYLDKDAILDLTKEEVTKVVMSLGSAEPKIDNQGNLIFQTICHNQPDVNNSYKLYYYHEPDEVKGYKGKTFKCYSGCGGECFSITELVIRAKRTQGVSFNWYKALYYIGQVTGKLITKDPVSNEKKEIISDFQWIDKFIDLKNKKSRAIPELKEVNENILDIFCNIPHSAWLEDNCSRESMSRYEISYYGLTDQIVIPHRDKNGKLIGLRGRFLCEKDYAERGGKYMPLVIEGNTYSHQLGSNLYGLNVVVDKIKRCKKVMLVEAEKSCLQSFSYYGDDSFTVALCGSAITLTQQKIILKELQVEEIIFAPDRDYIDSDSFEAEAWYNKQVMKLAPLVPYVKCCLIADKGDSLGYKDSPTDKGREVLEKLLDNKIHVTMDEVKRVQSEMRKE